VVDDELFMFLVAFSFGGTGDTLRHVKSQLEIRHAWFSFLQLGVWEASDIYIYIYIHVVYSLMFSMLTGGYR